MIDLNDIDKPGAGSDNVVILPSDSRFIDNTDVIIEFIKSIIKEAENATAASAMEIRFDLSKVERLDEAMINILLTLVNYLDILGYDYIGNFPINKECRDMLVKSGFLNHVETDVAIKSTQDTIFTLCGDNQTNDKAIGEEILKITHVLTDENHPYPPLYTTLGEIAANSVEHANADIRKKNWFLSVHYESDRVIVMMADIGRGILGTIGCLCNEVSSDTSVGTQSPTDILKDIFAGNFQSSTLEANRYNGLPDMVPRVKASFLNNIVVISNNAFFDFSGKATRILNNSFPGTFYLIEVTTENIEIWKNRSKS